MPVRKDYPDPLSGWAKLRNLWARDPSIDWGALGLLTYLTSHRDEFEVRLDVIYRARASKRHKIDRWLAELEQHGYLRRETKRVNGVVVGTVWHLLDPYANDPDVA